MQTFISRLLPPGALIGSGISASPAIAAQVKPATEASTVATESVPASESAASRPGSPIGGIVVKVGTNPTGPVKPAKPAGNAVSNAPVVPTSTATSISENGVSSAK